MFEDKISSYNFARTKTNNLSLTDGYCLILRLREQFSEKNCNDAIAMSLW